MRGGGLNFEVERGGGKLEERGGRGEAEGVKGKNDQKSAKIVENE